jgi:UDP-N-acetylglucosamine diphosphorylase/glucosamine-1-phosphate N-acetyltransferase
MRMCVYEDPGVRWLEPLTLTRPAFDLLCGASPLLEKHRRYFVPKTLGAFVRPEVLGVSRQDHPNVRFNDGAWLREEAAVLVNARWVPGTDAPPELTHPVVAMIGDQVAYAVLTPNQLTYCSPNTIDDCTETWKQTLPPREAGGWMIDYPWDLVGCHPAAMAADFAHLSSSQARSYRPANLTVVGPSDRVLVDPTATVEPLVVADTTHGPVIIDREARIQAFTRLEGPCYIGPETCVYGAKIRGCSIGPVCRVGGEVEASILLGYSNKYHEGFLGHSVVGEWVNIAAGVEVSDLRNDYGPVAVTLHGACVETGRTKVGAFIGDHTRFGLNALVNTGSVIGCYCNLLPTGGYHPRDIPSFTALWNGRLVEQEDLTKLLVSAEAAMRRRGCEMSPEQIALYEAIYEETASARRRAIRYREPRRLRQSA